MAKDKLTEYDATAANNTVVGDVNLAENSALPSDMNNAVREVMSHLKEFADGTNGINVLSLADDDASASIKFQAPSAVTATVTFTLPDGDGESGQTLVTNGSGTLAWHAPYGNRNLIINGAMQVAQRGASAVTVSDGSNEGYTTVDRYYLNFNASIGGAIAVSQSTDTPSGFANSIKLDCTAANTSISGTQMIDLQHRFEAQDLQQLGFGSSDAQPITVSWYMKAVSFSDNISVTLNTRDGTKEYFVKSFTPTTSWARYTMTVPGSTSATIDNNNGEGLRLSWVVAGSSSGTHAASSDSTAFSTTRADYRSDIGNLTASTDNELYITGVQLEVGEQATPFEHRSFGDELVRCQRYHTRIEKASGQALNSSQTVLCGVFPVEMRTTPTASLSAALTIFQLGVVGSKGQSSSNISVNTDINSGSVFNAECGNFSSLTTHQATAVAGGTQPLIFDAEL